ncbi:receptor protein kinase-like protein [Trifolium medium]|uniref:Receptor protein kinase-like protein n=1 Tax=Trifolium medium TaxID=97028 RepID=A0A392M5S7_9FABA|nr:receptor protein kinase-like protein [Trifolium medium]
MGNYIPKLCYALLFILLHSALSINGYFNSTIRTKEVKCKARERKALLRFKQGLQVQDDYDMLSTWRDDEKNRDCCKWKRIRCSNETGHVLMLDLHELGNLSQLKYLNIQGNNLVDEIPCELGNLKVPKSIGLLSMLEYLILNKNSLEGEVNESHFASLSNLISRYDYYILLMWKGVEDVFKNPDLLLKSIDLSGNNLTGEIPKEIMYGIRILNRWSFLNCLGIISVLQSFGASSYEGNLGLCGKPLEKACSDDDNDVPLVFDNEIEDDESSFYETFYTSLGLGFAVGFWGFIGPLLLLWSWRYSYIRFLNRFKDGMHVMVIRCYAFIFNRMHNR